MNFENVNVPKVLGGGIAALLKASIIGGIAVYGAANSLYNVRGRSSSHCVQLVSKIRLLHNCFVHGFLMNGFL